MSWPRHKDPPIYKSQESKDRVAAMVEQVKGGMGSGVPNFRTGTFEERQEKASRYNLEKQEAAERFTEALIKHKSQKGY